MAKSVSSRRGSNARRTGSINTDLRDSPRNSLTSLTSLREEEEEEKSCRERFNAAVTSIYNYTIAGCIDTFRCCCCSKRRSYDSLDDPTSDEDNNEQLIETQRVKNRLKFHFMNPFEKWKYDKRRRFPWKLVLQLSIILLATIQLWVFAGSKSQFNSFLATNKETFESLFVTNPDNSSPTNYYDLAPLSTITTMDEFWAQMEFTKEAYYNIVESAVGPYGYGWNSTYHIDNKIPPLVLHIRHYPVGSIKPDERLYNFSGSLNTSTINISQNSSVRAQLNDSVIMKKLPSITAMWMSFDLSSVYLHSQSNPLCCQFHIHVRIENKVFSGTMLVDVKVMPTVMACSENSTSDFERGWRVMVHAWVTSLDIVVLIITFVHTLLCIRSLYSSKKFSTVVKRYFKEHFNYRLKLQQCLPLYNLWFLGAIAGNLLVAVGSIMKIMVFYQLMNTVEAEDITSIVFGLGVFCQWCGMLRFLSYFDKYNMLLLTLRISLPSVIRFMMCAGILYVAFLLLGWLVLGPYHPKFKDPSVTSECLYSLINGDDMFNTYIMMSDISFPAFIFSKIYLYLFISLFIYVVLSVFISLISDTYETLHEHWSVRSKGLLHDFAHDHAGLIPESRLHDHHQYPQGVVADTEYEFLASNVAPQMSLNDEEGGIGSEQIIVNNGSPLLSAPHIHNLRLSQRRNRVSSSSHSSTNSSNKGVPGVIITENS